MARSRIEWTTDTWNPVTGCTKVSPGCDHCYAQTFAERWRGVPGHVYEKGFDLQLRPERLAQPLEWRKPRMIFVNSMSDLFHVGVPDDFIVAVFNVMKAANWHKFQIFDEASGETRSPVGQACFSGKRLDRCKRRVSRVLLENCLSA